MKRTLVLIMSLILASPRSYTQTANSNPQTTYAPANGAGIMVAGELWDSFLPPNAGPSYREPRTSLNSRLLRMGNFDRAWSVPTHMWPGGWTNGNFWGKDLWLMEFNPDTIWNPRNIEGAANPAYYQASGSQYSFGAFSSAVAGASDPTRNYKYEVRWADPQTRNHAIYEAGWPTNIGVDVQVKVHQFTLNWNNFNDFILVEVTLTNTGNLDMNADGRIERTGNAIRALTMLANGEFISSTFIGRNGGRGRNAFGASRSVGYVGDIDPKGSPWDMMVGFPGESGTGVKDMGLNDLPLRFYTDVWNGWSWLAVKRGQSTSTLLHTLPDKQSIYGTHAIGEGPQRGWYASAGTGRLLGVCQENCGSADPKAFHTIAMSTWYKDGGKNPGTGDSARLSPNPNFFAGGVTGDPTTFVPKTNPQRPNGDRKLFSEESTSAFDVNPYEPSWSKGFTSRDNFDGDMLSGIGPFSLGVGESMTIVWSEAGAYRLQGIQNAIAAARWAFENGYALPEPPAVPELRVDNTFAKTVKVRWDNRAETHLRFAGYKVYKASLAKQISWLETGMRGLDEYWRSTIPGAVPQTLLRPVNPSFSAQAFVGGRNGTPDSWGPYELVANIPRIQLGTVADPTSDGFSYSWEDKTVDLGAKYWYYVAAYTTDSINLGATYAGLNDAMTTTLETSNINRNGASGLWMDTYPFADLNSFFPKTSTGQKAIGSGFVVKSAVASPVSLASGAVKISVKPNPYKKKGIFDSATDPYDHKVKFYNLPPYAKITILDVSGQIVDEIRFESTDLSGGYTEWDMFSKDGIEVASGLYVYVVEYEGGQQVGYLSILR